MNDDLSDVGLNALEALEAQDEQETSSQEDGGEEKDAGEIEVTNTSENENETNDEVSSDEEDDTKADNSDAEEADEDTKDEKPEVEEKKELSDEEFEEMAKKRGYSKAQPEEEKKKAEEKANAERASVEKLTARPKEVDEEVWESLPVKNKIVYNALPYITVVGKDGVLQIKTPDQLPDDFEFASKKDEAKFYNELQAQEMRAEKMTNALEQREQRSQRAEAQRNEARNIIGQIEKLQKNGDLPTPKAKNGSREFDNDPAVVLINKVLGYRSELARKGVNVPIRESLLLFKSEHPEEFQAKEAKGDTERKNIAKKVAGNSKASGTAVNKDNDNRPQYYRQGMSMEDVLDRVLEDMD